MNKLPDAVSKPLTDLMGLAFVGTKLPNAVAATVERPGSLIESVNKVDKLMVATRLMKDIFIENGIRPEIIQHVPF
ncbi:hypothetical protein ABTU79_20155, partial [Acinetobacter baumannii]